MTALALVTDAPAVTLRDAITRWQASLEIARKSPGTIKGYLEVLRRLQGDLGAGHDAAEITGDWLLGWVMRNWDTSSPSTWNHARAALISAWTCWERAGLVPRDIARAIPSRRLPEPPSRAIDGTLITTLVTLPDAPLRERCLWSMLYATGARVHEILALNVEHLDRDGWKAEVIRKGGRRDTVLWDSRTAKLLGRYINGRTCGPLFLTERKAPEGTLACDMDPDGYGRLGYHRARRLYREHTAALPGGPWDLHQLRHSRGTHARQAGADDSMVMALLGHRDARTMRRYSRVSTEQMREFVDRDDKARRRAGR